MTFGEQNTQDEAFAQLDYALERGLYFWDTAEMYPVPPKPETQGATEVMIGNWLKARGGRGQAVFGLKNCWHRLQGGSHIRDGTNPLQRHRYSHCPGWQPETPANRLY